MTEAAGNANGSQASEFVESELSRLFTCCPDGVLVSDPEGRVLTANESMCRMLGCQLSDLRGVGVATLHPRELAPVIQADLSRAVENEQHQALSIPMVRRDGSSFFADINGSVVRLGGRLCLIGFFRDITPRVEAERRSRIKHDLLQALAATDSLEDGIRLSLDAAIEAGRMSGGVVYLVDAGTGDLVMRAHRGLSPEFVRATERIPVSSPRHVRVLSDGPLYGGRDDVHPSIRAEVEREGLRALASLPVVHKNRALGALMVTSRTEGAVGEAERVALETIAAGAGQAIARLQAQEALAEREEIFAAVLAQSADSVTVIDGETLRFLEFNTAAHRDLGYTREEFSAMGIPDIQAEHTADQIRANTRAILERGPSSFETRHRHKDGSVRDVLVRAQRLERAGHRCLAAVWTDITERKRAEAQLRQAQKLEAVGQLAGGVAHDFNNILAAVLMQVGMLRDNPRLDPTTHESLAEVDRSAQRAAALTRQLLMFSRRSVLTLRALDLDEVVSDLLKMLRRLIGEDVDLRFEPQGRLPPVEADAGMMEQVLLNLVVNARDAMPAGGHIRIATDTVDLAAGEGPAGREARPPGRYVRLVVTDSGHGMDAATLGHIFEPFFTTKEAGKGTGLGLATVHGIVAQHRGFIDVQSEPGRGTTFRVHLPANSQAAPGVAEAGHSEVPHGHEVVLVVEDDPMVRLIVSRSLQRLGYRLHEAASGREALRLWQDHGAEIDLLLTDMVMPEGMNGLELADRLRAEKPDLKIILSSGYSAEVAQAGMSGRRRLTYLAKPYTPSTLARVVRTCLDE